MTVCIILLLVFGFGNTFAGNGSISDTTFSFSTGATAGITSNMEKGLSNTSFSPGFRMYWSPNHKLDLGLEVAYVDIKSEQKKGVENEFGETDFKASLTGIPILAVYRMNLWKLQLKAGVGTAYVRSVVDAFDTKVTAGRLYYCYYFSIGYKYPLSDGFAIGIEIQNYNLPRLEHNLAGASLALSYDILRW